MSLLVTAGETEAGRHNALRPVETENIDHNLALQTPLPSSPSEYLNDINARDPIGSTTLPDSHARVNSLLQLQTVGIHDSASGKRRYAKGGGKPMCVTPEATSTTTVKSEPTVELKENDKKRLSSSAESTEQMKQTTNSSKEALSFDSSPGTSVSPWGTPRGAGSLLSTNENRSIGPHSSSDISDFTRLPTIYKSSDLPPPAIRDFTSRRINPKEARLRNRVHNFNYQAQPRAPTLLGTSSSVATGKRPVGFYGIGEQSGFPPAASRLASCSPRSSTPYHDSTVPSRTDSKRQADSVNISNIQTDSLPTQEISSLIGETLLQPTASDPAPCKSSADFCTANMSVTSSPGNRLSLECAEPIPRVKTRSKERKHISLLTAFCATAPSAFGCYGEAVQIFMAGNPLDHVVPLSDAYPLLVGSLALRHKLCQEKLYPEDPRVPNILKKHAIAIDRVSYSDQVLLWHLTVHDRARNLSNTTSFAPILYAIYWKTSDDQYSEVHLTPDNLIGWLNCREQAHQQSSKLRTREFERLATCSTYSRDRMMSHRDQ
jgi:hypothetical protein